MPSNLPQIVAEARALRREAARLRSELVLRTTEFREERLRIGVERQSLRRTLKTTGDQSTSLVRSHEVEEA